MTLNIITADQRLKVRQKVNVALFGPAGVGKTFQVRTLNPEKTLFIDAEAGTLSIQDWQGATIDVRAESSRMNIHPWELLRGITCLLGGADPAAGSLSPYSRQWFEQYEKVIGPKSQFDQFDTVFIDSITVASRMALAWSKLQPEAVSEKTGKPDTRGAYGLLGQEVVTWLTQCQHIRDKNVIVVGVLDMVKDDTGRITYEPQIEGSKAVRELPGIFDQVITMGLFDTVHGSLILDMAKGTQRGFICHQNNGFGVPAKDRSGRLAAIEPPDLGAILNKIQENPRIDAPVFAFASKGEEA